MLSRLLAPLSDNDVEEEISIAYMHAVCASARMGFEVAGRHKDNRGVDGLLSAYAPFGPDDGYRESVDIHVQLKATKQQPKQTETHFSYFLDSVSQYDVLKSDKWGTPRILVVMFLPKNIEEWVDHSHERLLLQRCAYWISLLGAAPCGNKSGQTVYLPKAQCLDAANLLSLCSHLSHPERPRPLYQLP